MPEQKAAEKRRRERTPVKQAVEINGGVPYRGGKLLDISSSGAAVVYNDDTDPADRPLKMGDERDLIVAGVTTLPTHVARTFDGGYAVEFNWGVDLRDAFK